MAKLHPAGGVEQGVLVSSVSSAVAWDNMMRICQACRGAFCETCCEME